jgi:large subunit ribosomal protein L4e
LVADDKLQEVSKATELLAFFDKMGLLKDVERASKRKTRGGRQSWRGRGRKNGKGPLLVISDSKGLDEAAGGFRGVDVVKVDYLSVIDLAPGGKAGRLTVWTKSALDSLTKRFEEAIASAA